MGQERVNGWGRFQNERNPVQGCLVCAFRDPDTCRCIRQLGEIQAGAAMVVAGPACKVRLGGAGSPENRPLDGAIYHYGAAADRGAANLPVHVQAYGQSILRHCGRSRG